jgi:hypothetical protein
MPKRSGPRPQFYSFYSYDTLLIILSLALAAALSPLGAAAADDDDPEATGEAPLDDPADGAGAQDPGAPPAPPSADAAPPTPGDVTLPPEADLLPPEFTQDLPSNIKRILKGPDYLAIKARCASDDPDAFLACLTKPDVEAFLDNLLAKRIIDSMLEVMDAELPVQLEPDDYDHLVEACEAPADAWMDCFIDVDYTKRPDLQAQLAATSDPATKATLTDDLHALETACDDQEEAFASCLSDDEMINELYLYIQDEKKKIFGKEVFIEFAGLLSALTLKDIKSLREACPQNDLAAAKACFKAHPDVQDDVDFIDDISRAIVEEVAEELNERGLEMKDEKYEALTERFNTLFLTLPGKSINSLYRACEKKHPNLQNLDSEQAVDKLLDCMAHEAEQDPVANPAFIARDKLLSWINKAEAIVLTKIRDKAALSQAKSTRLITYILLIVAILGGLVVLLLPLKLRKQYPGKDAIIWRAGGLAAATFVLSVLLLGVCLLTMRTVQNSVAAEATNPQLRVAVGTFDILKRETTAENFSNMTRKGLDFVKTPLRKLQEKTALKRQQADAAADAAEDDTAFIAVMALHWADMLQEPEVKRMAKNATLLKGQADTFKGIIGFFKKINWLMGMIPIILSLLAVVLYLLPLKKTLLAITRAPAEIASGATDTATVFKRTMTTIKAEARSLLPFMGIILLFIPITGFLLALAVPTTVEVLLEYAIRTVFYLLFQDALASVLYASLGSAMALLVLMLALFIIATTFFLGSSRKLLQLIYHEGHTFAQHKDFWVKGSLFIVGAMLLPVLYSFGLEWVFNTWVKGDIKTLSAKEMVTLPLLGALLLPAFFWAARGFKLFGYVKRYPVPFMPAPAPTPKDVR